MAKTKLVVGQTVRLKSGGPNMTISEVPDRSPITDKSMVECQWFGGRKLERGWFPTVSLVPTDETEEKPSK